MPRQSFQRKREGESQDGQYPDRFSKSIDVRVMRGVEMWECT